MYSLALNPKPYDMYPPLQSGGMQSVIGQQPYAVLPPLGMGCVECGQCGMGFFDSGLDWNGWGWLEWGAIFLGAYALGSMLFTGKQAAQGVRSYSKRRKRTKAIRERMAE